jgi:hypothetical protein
VLCAVNSVHLSGVQTWKRRISTRYEDQALEATTRVNRHLGARAGRPEACGMVGTHGVLEGHEAKHDQRPIKEGLIVK